MKITGFIFLILGIAGDIIFGLKVADQSNSFHVAGLDLAVSHANWTPLIISGILTIIGIIVLIIRKR